VSEIQYAAGDFAGTAETGARWIGLDGLNERAYRRKMRAHFSAGERGQALETYTACQAILMQELHAQPEPDTEALAEHIRSQQRPAVAVLDSPATPVSYLESKFAGRTAELQVLVEHYRRAAQGQLQVVIVSGEAGIGKTRLAVEFLAWCRSQGAEVLRESAFESGSHMPLQPLVEALRSRLTQLPQLLAGAPRAGLASLARLLPELQEGYPGLGALPADLVLSQTQLFEPLTRLTLHLAGPAPLVLFLDDLQWADSATLEMLQYAARRWHASAAAVLLLLDLRSEALQPATRHQPARLADWLAQVERQLPVRGVPLAALGQAATVELVRSLLAPPADDFAQWVFDETHGQPFYLMETLKDLLERGVLRSQRQPDGAWGFQVDAEHDLGRAARVPSTVRVVIRARLDRLSPPAAELLAAAAVLERDLTFDRLCQVANVSEDVGLPALDELLSSRVLLEVGQPDGASAYAFANDMLRDVVYTEAGDARRRLFHRRTLEVLTAAGKPAALLAHHALAAGQTEAALRYSLSASQEALRLSAAGEARMHLELAQNLARHRPAVQTKLKAHIHDLYIQLGRAFERDGQPEQASAIYAELERLAPKAPK
jgi:predicted ATPase